MGNGWISSLGSRANVWTGLDSSSSPCAACLGEGGPDLSSKLGSCSPTPGNYKQAIAETSSNLKSETTSGKERNSGN